MKLVLPLAGLCLAVFQCASPALSCPEPFCAQVVHRPAASTELLVPDPFRVIPNDFTYTVPTQDKLTEAYARGLNDLEELMRVLREIKRACKSDENCATKPPEPEPEERRPRPGSR